MVFADSHGISRAPCYLGTALGGQCFLRTGLLPSLAHLSSMLPLNNDFVTPRRIRHSDLCTPLPPHGNAVGLSHHTSLGSSRFARRYSGSRCCFPFLGVLRCFSSPGCLLWPYVFRPGYERMTARGFPHSDILGSQLARSFPRLFAACHVLHRLLAPRHPPWALYSLTR